MIKNKITSGAYTSGNIPMTNLVNTNQKYALVDNAIEVRISGITDVIANVVASVTTGGTLTLQLYADDVAVPGAIDSQTVGANSTHTFHINEAIKTVYQYNPSFTKLSVRFDTACNLIDGDFIAEYVR